jgi:hypothetical protein
MKVNSDCLFQIGTSHKVCEDFALVSKSPLGLRSFALVADGCSSSMVEGGMRCPINVDIGARLLALAAKKAISDRYMKPEEENEVLQEKILENLKIAKSIYELPSSVFDSTLVLAVLDQCTLRLFWYGDGVAVIETDLFIDVITVEFLSGAPYYLSYQLSRERNQAYYKDFFGQSMKKTWVRIDKKTGENRDGYSEYVPTSYQYDVYDHLERYSCMTVTLFTDGVNTFNTEDRLKTIVDCASYPSKVGAYVWKRVNLLNKWMRKSEISHYDDLGIASLDY